MVSKLVVGRREFCYESFNESLGIEHILCNDPEDVSRNVSSENSSVVEFAEIGCRD
jgi:hypothetical protein